jgi:hypothetical protein
MMGITINAAGQFLSANGQVTTYTTAQLADMGLPVTADKADWNATQWKSYWHLHITTAWAAGHHKGQSMPKNQTIEIVTPGDCQWKIATDAGASPVETAYQGTDGIWLNGQFQSNPDLIHPGDIEFVAPTTKYTETKVVIGTDPKTGAPIYGEWNNTDIFANQTRTAAAKGDLSKVNVANYLRTLQTGATNPTRALATLLLGPDWGTSSDPGNTGRRTILDQYFSGFQPGEERIAAGEDLKKALGLGVTLQTWWGPIDLTDQAHLKANFERIFNLDPKNPNEAADLTRLVHDAPDLNKQINAAAGIGEPGPQLAPIVEPQPA